MLEWVAISPGDLSDPGIEPGSPALQADSLSSEPPRGGICISTTELEARDNKNVINCNSKQVYEALFSMRH